MTALLPSLRRAVGPSSFGFTVRPIRSHRIVATPGLLSTVKSRAYSESSTRTVEPPEALSHGEKEVFEKIKGSLQPTMLEVQDISGGCGSMYRLDIVSEHFKGLPMIKQHRLVNKVLGDEIKSWHGVRMNTKAPE